MLSFNNRYHVRGGFLALLSLLIPCLLSAQVWINEFHYDNDGADMGEFVELAGVAGTDLSGYSVVLYNGGGSPSGGVYGTISISSVSIANENNTGYGTAWFERSGIQNGAPDGLALVNADGQVLEFISYEGSIVASSGPAAGMTSTNIGIEEDDDTPAGHSLQRTGFGRVGSDFMWAGPTAASPAALNAGQTFPVAARLGGTDYGSIQNAIDAAPAGATLEIIAGTYAEELDFGTKQLRVVFVEE